MSKIVEIKASSTWTREDLPGYHVRYTIPDDGVVTIDGVPDLRGNNSAAVAPSTPAGQAVAANQKPYVSELAQALLGRWRTDAAGNLIDGNTGAVLTRPTPDDPWPAVVDTVAALLQFQFDHASRIDQIYIDGVKYGQPGIDPGVRYSSSTGKLTLEFSPPVAQLIAVPPAAPGAIYRLTIEPPAGGQIRPTIPGEFVVTLPNLRPPTMPGRLGFIKVADAAGGTATGTIVVTGPYGDTYSDRANGFSCALAIDSPGEIGFYCRAGDTLTVTSAGITAPVYFDYRSAN